MVLVLVCEVAEFPELFCDLSLPVYDSMQLWTLWEIIRCIEFLMHLCPANLNTLFCKNNNGPWVFKVYLCYTEFKKIKSNWSVVTDKWVFLLAEM